MATPSLDFLSDENVCGQTLLRLVARGSAITSELLRLAERIPDVFRSESPEHRDIVFDFSYLKNTAGREAKIESSARLLELDQEFRDAHVEILVRFYQLFESISTYAADLRGFFSDVDEGIFIQISLSKISLDSDGKQLLVESLYMMGVMLLLLEYKVPGPVRERLLVSYLRYIGSSESPNVEQVMSLCGDTGFRPNTKKYSPPKNWPQSLFARTQMPEHVVSMALGRLRADDVFHQTRAYPSPEHRSVALRAQAGMLFVVLFFAPDVLSHEEAAMREVVDRHFPDNWVVAFYLGFTVDLTVVWGPYRAAAAAISNTVAKGNVERLTARYVKAVPEVLAELRRHLAEGVLTADYILDRTEVLLETQRKANVTLQWLLLQANATNAKLADVIRNSGFSLEDLFALLLDTAQFEYELRRIFEQLLSSKEAKWLELRNDASLRMTELAEYFTGEKALTRVEKNVALERWFTDLSIKVTELDFHDATLAGRKIQLLSAALEEVEQFQQIEESLQVVQFLRETRKTLQQMMRTVNAKEDVLIAMGVIGDMSYAWLLVERFVPLMHERIRRAPDSVVKLRSVFLKMSATIMVPLQRIAQVPPDAADAAGGDGADDVSDLKSVSEYHSTQLVRFVRRVLEIVPRSMFVILKEIIRIITTEIRDLDVKVSRDAMRDLAQLRERASLARLTYQVSVFTEGILAMETTLVGVIKVDPKKLLEDGVRKQLVAEICAALDSTLDFSRAGDPDEFAHRVQQLGSLLDGFKRSLSYIQDYLNLHGLRVWQEEISRIVGHLVEMESNSFLKRRLYDWQSRYQSEAIPIPSFPRRDDQSINCIGRLVRALLAMTSPSTSVYLDSMNAWFDRSGREVVTLSTFNDLLNAIDVFGLAAIDKLLCFMCVQRCRAVLAAVKAYFTKDKSGNELANELMSLLDPATAIPKNAARLYAAALKKASRAVTAVRSDLAELGQLQLLRRAIADALAFRSRLDAATLNLALTTADAAVLSDVREHYNAPLTKPFPDAAAGNPLLPELTDYLERAGLADPMYKLYVTSEPIPFLPLVLMMTSVSAVAKLQFDRRMGVLFARKPDKATVDETPFVVGTLTLLRQVHSVHTQRYLAFMGQYVRAHINGAAEDGVDAPATGIPPESVNGTVFMLHFSRFGGATRENLGAYVPSHILDSHAETS
mmetsp:Transcript_12857/g.40591  ORF Transcript_12857/g.40591 Transcript_12857/m.40591 type:complete len:1173 (-) Transcript_12857:1104-4622(-)